MIALRRNPALAEAHGSTVTVPVAHNAAEAAEMDRHDREIDEETDRYDREHR